MVSPARPLRSSNLVFVLTSQNVPLSSPSNPVSPTFERHLKVAPAIMMIQPGDSVPRQTSRVWYVLVPVLTVLVTKQLATAESIAVELHACLFYPAYAFFLLRLS